MTMPQPEQRQRITKGPFLAVTGLLLTGMLMVLISTPIHDPDLWWHLATGRHIIETHGLLSGDPFSLAGADITPGREGILNGYLLAQVAMYACHLLAGDWGIIVLFALLLTAVPASLLVYGARRGMRSWELLIVATLCGWVLLYYSGARPNLFTIALTPLLLLLFNEIGFCQGEQSAQSPPYNLRPAALTIPFMLLWANLHGGYILGAALIIVYLLGETAKRVVFRPGMPLRPLVALWGLLSTAVLATLCNPNGAALYRGLFAYQGSAIQQKTTEYASPFQLADGGWLLYPYFLLAALLLTLLILRWRRTDLTEAGLALFLLAISCTAVRYVPLFAGGAAFITVKLLFDTAGARATLAKVLPAIAVTVLVATFSWAGVPHLRGTKTTSYASPLQPGRFPEGASAFLVAKHVTGTLFNHFSWGGYLAWRGTPKLKTFIDGRTVNEPLFHAYTRALWLPKEAQGILDQYGVNVIVMPRLNPVSGEFYALNDFLYQSQNWTLVFRDATSMVLIRKGSVPPLSDQPALPKRLIFQDALADAERRMASGDLQPHVVRARDLALKRLATTMR